MVGTREERNSRALVVTGEGREGDRFFGIMGRRQLTPGWEDDPVAESGWKNTAGEAGHCME